MIKKIFSLLLILVVISCLFGGCASQSNANVSIIDEPSASVSGLPSFEESEPSSAPVVSPSASAEEFSIISAITLDDVPAYNGQPFIEINDNIPFFADELADCEAVSFEQYAPLDELGRCGVAYACVGIDLMPTQERGDISDVHPTGWEQAQYDSVDGGYLYNRSHLIGYQLSGEDDNERNLITGTRYMNTEGMLPFENMVADYVKETENHVLYRVTPVFDGGNLLASGVLMEALSLEDSGDGICFNVFVYNVQPGITIDYSTGASSEDGMRPVQNSSETVTAAPDDDSGSSSGSTYILNTNTKKFHYPDCSSVGQMSEKNKKEFVGSRDEVIAMGYDPCKNCNP